MHHAETLVVGLDQYGIGHAFGSSHGHSRVFRTFYYDSIYATLAEAALAGWRELEALSGEQLLTLNGATFFAQRGNKLFDQNVRVLQDLKMPFELLSPVQVSNRFPALWLPTGVDACLAPRSGFLVANRSVRAHVLQALRFGVTILEGVCIRHIDVSKDGPEIETSAGRYRCDRLIVIPGPWALRTLVDVSLPLKVTRQQKFYFRPQHPSTCIRRLRQTVLRFPMLRSHDQGGG